jgi:hypothetical protein
VKVLMCAVLAAGVMLAFGGIAYANINPNANPVVVPDGGGNFRWTYVLATDTAEVINTPLTNPAFFTLYDVPGLVANSSSFTVVPGTLAAVTTEPLVGVTPSGVAPADNPLIPNISVAFTGTASISTVLGSLSFLDTLGTESTSPNEQFAAQATNAINNSRAFNSSFVVGPVPEPGSLVLLSSGMLGMVGMGLRRFRKR